MSTWGAANASDVSYSAARQRVRATLINCPAHSTIIASAPFLYEVNSFHQLRLIHADWLASLRRPCDPVAALVALKPQKLVLTQFDWYRRFKPLVDQLGERKDLVRVRVRDEIRIRPPDAYAQFQRLLQHTSWSPVIVEFEWQTPPPHRQPAR
jgi:hypothetical protein